MKFISIIGMMSEIDEVINVCGKSGIFQPDDVFSFYLNTKNFSHMDNENIYAAPLKLLSDTVKSSGMKLENVNVEDFEVENTQINEYVEYLSSKLGGMVSRSKEIEQNIEAYNEEIRQISHFTGLSVNLKDIFECKYVKPRFGKLSKEGYEKLESYDDPKLMFFPCTDEQDYYWGLYFAPVENEDEVDRIFSGLYFERIRIAQSEDTISGRIEKLNSMIKQSKNELEIIKEKIKSFWKVQHDQCMRFYSKLNELNTYCDIRKYVARYNDCFIMVGWIPKENEKSFCKKLSEINSVEYSLENGKNVLSHSPPVKLSNKKPFKAFEFFVDTYGLPSYDEIDPTIFVAITYTVLFGVMFADLGQGLLVSLVGYFMWKFKKMKLGKIMMTCGVSSAIFGTIFGSVFGFEHALDPFYKKVFGMSEKPIEVMDSSSTNMIIYSTVGIGIVLLIIAMLINIYSSVKRRRYANALFGSNGVCGLIFYISVVFLLLDSMMFRTGLVNTFYIILFMVVPVILMFFKEILEKIIDKDPNWKPEKWSDYILQNIFEMFEVLLSYLTNTVSFLRVGAFVLVHAGMMMVVFTIAEMCNPVGYVIAVVIGNIFVAALEALLSGIQVLRLEFYELFSRFFEAQGRPFTPVVIENK